MAEMFKTASEQYRMLFGIVQTPEDLANCPQLEARELLPGGGASGDRPDQGALPPVEHDRQRRHLPPSRAACWGSTMPRCYAPAWLRRAAMDALRARGVI